MPWKTPHSRGFRTPVIIAREIVADLVAPLEQCRETVK